MHHNHFICKSPTLIMNLTELFFGTEDAKTIEKEREKLLKKAYSLESQWAKKQMHKNEYHEIKSAIHKKLIVLDLEKSIGRTLVEIEGLALELGEFSSDKKVHKMLQQAVEISKVERELKRKFSKNKIEIGSFEKELRRINSDIIDLLNHAQIEVNRLKSDKTREIMAETQKRLRDIVETDNKKTLARVIEIPVHELEDAKKQFKEKYYKKRKQY